MRSLLVLLPLLVSFDAPKIGETVPALHFTDQRWLPRSLRELGEKNAYVLVFTTVDCPIVRRYLPRLCALEKDLRERGVQFVAVNVGRGDSVIEATEQALEHGADFPFVKDFDGSVVRALGVTRTPEVCVLDADRVLRYRGRVDDQYRVGGVRPEPSRDDLALAIEDVLADRDVEVAETPVDGCKIQDFVQPEPATVPTWSDDVAVLFQRHCQQCHRPGTEAPFPLLSYEDVLDHSEVIEEVVREERMPPWFASEKHGSFSNVRRMPADERRAMLDWLRSGTPAGDRANEPAPLTFPETEWRIGTPDLVITQTKESELPADGYVPYKYVILPQRFDEDTWVEAIEIKADNRRVLHHANLLRYRLGEKAGLENFITGQVPGGDATILDPGLAVKIPKGSVLLLQVHYITTGVPETNRMSVALRFPRSPVEKELHCVQITTSRFEIPPGAPNHEVRARRKFDEDSTGLGMFVHMHLRGKDMAFDATYPDGETERLLLVPNYNFDWQLSYRWDGGHAFPAGTRVQCTAHYDNSAFNPYNPDPTKSVGFGLQTYHEMMFGFLFYTEDAQSLNLAVDPATGYADEETDGE